MTSTEFVSAIHTKRVTVGIIGLGYVGLPLGIEFSLHGFSVLGFDIDARKIDSIERRETYIKHISSDKIAEAVEHGLKATTDFSRLPEVDAIIICVPTPLDEHREPDMSYVVNTAKVVSKYLRKGQLVSLESTTYPGTTDEILLPLFENAPIQQGISQEKFVVGKDFYLAFSPEREDPNNAQYSTSTIPKVVGGVTPECLEVAATLYEQVVVQAVRVSSTKVAESAKLLENIYRSVNIALVNELKIVLDRMGIDVWEVISAAKTKPFGFQAFYPGPGLGGHCIPIDPFYLTWKAREYEVNTKFIELAGEINTSMPLYVVEKTMEALNTQRKALNGSHVLILGAAYKKDIDDMRESPTLKLIELLHERGAEVSYHDPYVPKLPRTRKYAYDLESVELSTETITKYDVVLISTDHSSVDYTMIAEKAHLVVDTRNAIKQKYSTVYKA